MAVATTTNVGQRRVVFGINVVIQVVLVGLVAVLAVYLAQCWPAKGDWTRAGANSLGERTEKLLAGLDQNVTVTALYTVLSEYDEAGKLRQSRVRDFLKLYESAGHGHVTARLVDPMKDRSSLPALLQRLREKPAYRDQAKPHEDALRKFGELNPRISEWVERNAGEFQRLLAASGENPSRVLVSVGQELGRLQQEMTDVNRAVQELQAADIPRYDRAVQEVRSYLEALTKFLQAVHDWVQNKAAAETGLTPEGLALFQRLDAEAAPLTKEAGDWLSQTADLPRIELEDLSNELNRWASAPPIVVETETKAAVVPFNEVWPFRQSRAPNPRGEDREFAGERAVSSAVLKLTQKEKTAVIFTRFGGPSPIMPDFSQMTNMREMPRAPFGTLNELLGEANFVTADWDVATSKTPPDVPDAARRVFVVFPPTPPEQPDPRRPPATPGITPDDVQKVLDAVDAAGMAVFLAGCSEGVASTGGSGQYEYADYLKSRWGIEVQHECLALQFVPSREDPGLFMLRRPPLVVDTSGSAVRFTDQAIGKPLQALTAGLFAACPLTMVPRDEIPSGVKVEPILTVEETSDLWAVRNVMQVDQDLRARGGTSRRSEDVVPPFALAVAAEKEGGQRVVVFGSSLFVANPILEMIGGFGFSGGSLVAVPAYAANSDLFLNAVHWLTNDADRISVGAQPTEVPRLDKLKDDAALRFWRVFLVGIWPGLALVVGGGVWLFRRR